MKTRRSMLVSWLLGASAVALLTFSFEALSAREQAPGRCPATGAVSGAVVPATASCPAARAAGRSPAGPAVVNAGRCPAAGRSDRRVAPPSGCPAGAAAARTVRLRV